MAENVNTAVHSAGSWNQKLLSLWNVLETGYCYVDLVRTPCEVIEPARIGPIMPGMVPKVLLIPMRILAQLKLRSRWLTLKPAQENPPRLIARMRQAIEVNWLSCDFCSWPAMRINTVWTLNAEQVNNFRTNVVDLNFKSWSANCPASWMKIAKRR